MDRRTFVAIAAGALLGLPMDAPAQGPATARRIGFLSAFPRADIDAYLGQLRSELEKFGWTDGRDLIFLEPRTTEAGTNACRPRQRNSWPWARTILVQTVRPLAP
jgi:hypothetical protein